MAEVSYPSPAHNTRNVTDAEYEKIAARFSDDGVYGVPGSPDPVVAGTGLQVLVKAGTFASVRGHAWDSGTTDTALAITSNASGSTRVDWVVLRLDRSTWTVRATVLEGTPGAGSPAITQDTGTTGVFDIPLALVTVLTGAASVTVTPYTLYVGSRVRPTTALAKAGFRTTGEIDFETDTGTWVGWDGSTSHTIHSDSGDIVLSGGFNTWEQRDTCVGRRIGNTVSLRMSYRRIGSTFHSSDSSGSRLAVLPETLTPRWYQFYDVSFGNGAIATVRVQSDGEVWVEAPSKDVAENRVFRQTMTYFK